MSLWQRWFGRYGAEARRRDLDDEIAAHLAMAAAERETSGADAATARHEAEREFGNAALVKDVARESRGWMGPERLLQDARYALRQMRRSPGFAVTVIGTLALGIGAATAMFTVVDHVMLRPLPYAQADRLVTLSEASQTGRPGFGVTYPDVRAWAEQSHAVEKAAFYNRLSPRDFLQNGDASVRVSGELVSANLFDVLGVHPQLGRGFDEDASGLATNGNPNVMVLSYGAWQTVFHGDTEIAGRAVKVNTDTYTVVGVMPQGFSFPFDAAAEAPQIWVLGQPGPKDMLRNSDTPNYEVIARLRQGIAESAAAAELNTLQKQVVQGYADAQSREDRAVVRLRNYADTVVDADLKRALLVLSAATGVLWLIACINVTHLLLARATTRRREIAMRGALGASRGRIVQQLAVEGLMLSGVAAVLGTAIGMAVIRLSRGAIPTHLKVDMSAHVNLTILSVLCALTLLSAVISSVWPALLAARAPIEPALKQGGRQSGAGRGMSRLRGLLVVAEIAMSLTLLAGCGLLLRTLYTLRHVPLGFRTDHILVADLSIPSWRFTGMNMTTSLYQPLLDQVQQMPGVQAAGLMTEVPLGNTFNVMLTLNGEGHGMDSAHNITAVFKSVSPSIQKVLGFRLLAGRFFDERDTPSSQPVFVVNRAFAERNAPDPKDPASIVGTNLWHFGKTPAQVIGVLDDERQSSIMKPSQPEIEASIRQLAPGVSFYSVLEGNAMDIALRTSLPPEQMIPQFREILRKASPEFAHVPITTMDRIVDDSYGSQRLAAHLLEVFGGSALLLCIAGLYGLLAYLVSQRTREMGVRLALGAPRSSVLLLMLREAGAMILTGVAVGTVFTLVSGRLIRSWLYGVTAHDFRTLAVASLLLAVSGLAAAWLPARRAASVDPVEALRAE
ncbi:ABC transporter permease [Paracidobacterium acidisoli]|nr:ABC transporter permease [Paracidobacterium acidisoli]MBT9329621.1 ABC transporter permease [Paracidobacterium acidisoli]